MCGEHALELDRVVGRAGVGKHIGIEKRQRIVGERNAGDLGFGKRQLLGHQSRKPSIVRAGAQRAGHHQDLRAIHTDEVQAFR